jgi:rubrerythrin
LSEQEILALAISSEETDARIYADFAAGLKADYPGTSQIFKEMEVEEDEHRRELIEEYRRRYVLSFTQSYGREEMMFALDRLGPSGGFPGFGFLLPRMRD